MAKNRRKKLALGGSIDPQGERLYMEYMKKSQNTPGIISPNDSLALNNLAMNRAEAKAESNPWTQALDVIGNLALQVGSSVATSGGGFGGKKVAAYGANNIGSKVEIEGEETVHLPSNETIKVKGPSHEQGGIDTVLPVGTDVFSKRIKIDDKTLADRKLKREKLLSKYEKKLKKDPNNTLLKNSYERLKQTTSAEDDFDMNLQLAVGNNGTGKQVMAKGGITGIDPNTLEILNQLAKVGTSTTSEPIEKPNDLEILKKVSSILSQGKGSPTTSEPVTPVAANDTKSGVLGAGTGKDTVTDNDTGEGGNGFKLGGAGTPTGGDLLGIVGNLYQGFKPRQLTRQNRSLDVKNPNFYENYGKRGLKTIQAAKDTISGITDQNLKDLALQVNSTLKRGRNSARGVNTMRALDLGTFAGANSARGNIYSNEMAQLASLLGQEAQMQNYQDQIVMGGEQTAFDNDTADRDNYFSQLAKDEVAVGQALSHTGKSINSIQKREIDENLINSLADMLEINTMTGEIKVKGTKNKKTKSKKSDSNG